MDQQAPVGESPAAQSIYNIDKTNFLTEQVKQVLVHFNVGHRKEITLFRTDTPQEQLKGL